ncbi:ankyrin repeat domain-containing protein [Dyadobacter chenhuakuii]|uniref:Ankyrin repeat domain-containing protein n=1 Tax=Dyadobacter chenhuakuii TaxID=2909339 RepID=A0A9X1QCF9_9BACT|nr:ankyrin repeat domain-containing protein [Dyadobacter chenhuakuii]MCF2498875.1 ankyrin repeat domain-containing protein [Dyadobacter chenhuakuii]
MKKSSQKLSADVIKLIEQGDHDTAKKYLNFVDRDGRSPVFYSIAANNTDMLRNLLFAGADSNLQDKNGWTPLHHAVQADNLEAIYFLLQSGANIEICDNHGNTPLWRAVFASKGKGDTISLLINSGANANAKNHSGISPRDLAEQISNYDIIQFF